jgi:hypothetical protein
MTSIKLESPKRRSETVSVRLDPKLRYLAELAARKQRRTLSSYIEWAIEASLEKVILTEGEEWNDARSVNLANAAADLWDVEDADKFAKLAFRYPDLLTHHEQVVWKLIRENGYLWRGFYHKLTNKFTWETSADFLIFETLRAHWNVFNDVARGDLDKSALPKWAMFKPVPKKPDADMPPPMDDDDIPF